MGNTRGLYDLHSHILPGIDDGSASCEESAEMLIRMKEQGIVGVAATPHYYSRESVEHFLNRREQARIQLETYIREKNINAPDICFGAEVAYRSGISHEERLRDLCYGNSNYLLLELPFARWGENVFKDLEIIRNVYGIIPVIAHVERYLGYQDRKTKNRLYDMNLYLQMNAECYLDAGTRRLAKKLVRNGLVQVLGSDAHNVNRRPPNLGMAAEEMCRKRMEEDLNEMNSFGKRIFEEAAK